MIIALLLILLRLEDAKYGYYHPFVSCSSLNRPIDISRSFKLCIFGYLFLCFQTFFVCYHVHSALNDNEMAFIQNH